MERRSLVPSVCPYCGVGCGLDLAVSDGIITGLEYMKEHPTNEGALCPKGNACLDIVYHRERLLYPMKKVNGQFQRTSWGDALALVVSKLGHIHSAYGANALAFLASAKATNEDNYVFQKLARLLGTNNVDHCARL
ncbi:Putative formate dehydrogenase [Gammaproteobacteria bacterium]|nr:Putative formate dehydrogenase [Gammaproteobacteria bacterium]